MAEFAEYLKDHGIVWPDNVVAMTSVTSMKNVARVHELLKVPAKICALSVKPLWEPVQLPLEGISWVITGGQSGPHSKRFDVEWALDLHQQCKRAGTS